MWKAVRYVVRVSRENVQGKRQIGSTRNAETRKKKGVRCMWEWNGGSSAGDGKAERMNEEGKQRRKDREWGATWELHTGQICSA
jgi:hypothetical protein